VTDRSITRNGRNYESPKKGKNTLISSDFLEFCRVGMMWLFG
jgi:hypothetical protein